MRENSQDFVYDQFDRNHGAECLAKVELRTVNSASQIVLALVLTLARQFF